MTSKKLLGGIIIALGILLLGLLWFPYPKIGGEKTNTPSFVEDILPKQAQQEEPSTIGLPSRLKIPSIGVDAHVEHVQTDAAGRMDVPKNSDNVAWYTPGYAPGQTGSAVISGHLDRRGGGRAVFWDLEKIKAGDELIVIDTEGNELKFKVTRTQIYNDKDFPLHEVFNQHGTPYLNLITCEGNFINGAYDKRLVVFSEMIE